MPSEVVEMESQMSSEVHGENHKDHNQETAGITKSATSHLGDWQHSFFFLGYRCSEEHNFGFEKF